MSKIPAVNLPIHPKLWIVSLSICIVSLCFAFSLSLSIWLPILIFALLICLAIAVYLHVSIGEVLFFLFPLIYPLLPAVSGIPEYKNWFALGWTFLLLTAFIMKGISTNFKIYRVRTHYSIFFILYGIILIISTLVNPINDRALSFVAQTVPLVILYWIITQYLSGENLNRLLIAIICAAVVNGLAFCVEFFGGVHKFTFAGFAYGFLRPVIWGVKANTWPYPSMIGLGIIMAFILHRKNEIREWAWILIASFVLLFIVGVNMSRSVLLGIFACGIYVSLTHPITRKWMLRGGVALGLAVISVLPFIYQSLFDLLRFRAGLAGRGQIWNMALAMLYADPIFGVGPSNFIDRFMVNSSFMRNGLMLNISNPSAHNVFLHVGVEIGIFGTLTLIALVIYFLYRSWQLWPKVKQSPYVVTFVAITAVFIGAFARSMFETELALQHGNLYKNLLFLVLVAFQDQIAHRVAKAA